MRQDQREAAERLVAQREAQGLPRTVEDPATLERLAVLVEAGLRQSRDEGR
jgi:hypothetical protein